MLSKCLGWLISPKSFNVVTLLSDGAKISNSDFWWSGSKFLSPRFCALNITQCSLPTLRTVQVTFSSPITYTDSIFKYERRKYPSRARCHRHLLWQLVQFDCIHRNGTRRILGFHGTYTDDYFQDGKVEVIANEDGGRMRPRTPISHFALTRFRSPDPLDTLLRFRRGTPRWTG